jgi:hypothetical protein
MAINERVKLLADLDEAAKKRGCIIPDAAKLIILNDIENRKTWNTDEYVRLPAYYVEELLEKREELH